MYLIFISSLSLIFFSIYYQCFRVKKLNFELDINNLIINNVSEVLNNKYLIEYFHNNTYYKLISSQKNIFYDEKDIKNYAFINKIKNATLKTKITINEEEKSYKIISKQLNILYPYLGVNYNFHNDLVLFTLKDILDIENIEYNTTSELIIIDSFDREYIFNLENYLKWNPTLIDNIT